MRDPKVEQVLDTNPNVAWEYVSSVPIRNINKRKSQQNQARIGHPVNQELARQYRDALINGDQFPALVLFPDGDEYVVSDGNHRLEGMEMANRQTVDAYLVLTDDAVERALLTFEWNVINGKANTEDDRDSHAVFLVKQGVTQKDVARRLHMPTRRVEEVVAEDLGHTRAVKMQVKSAWAKLPSRQSRVRLHRDLPLDSVFASAVKFAARFEIPTRDVKDFTAEVAKHGSEQQQLDYITERSKAAQREADRIRKESEAGRNSRKNRGANPRWLFEAHLQAIKNTVIGGQFREQILQGLTEEEKNALKESILTTRAMLSEAERQVVNA